MQNSNPEENPFALDPSLKSVDHFALFIHFLASYI